MATSPDVFLLVALAVVVGLLALLIRALSRHGGAAIAVWVMGGLFAGFLLLARLLYVRTESNHEVMQATIIESHIYSALFPGVFLLLALAVVVGLLVLLIRVLSRHGGAAIAFLGLAGLVGALLLAAVVGLFLVRGPSERVTMEAIATPNRVVREAPLHPPRPTMVPGQMTSDMLSAEEPASPKPKAGANEGVTVPAGAEAPIAATEELRLSVEAIPTAPTPRPEWVDATLGKGNKVFRAKVEVGPYATREECDRELPAELQNATATYVDRLLGAGASRRVTVPPTYLNDRVLRGEWLEPTFIEVSGVRHSMVRLHALLEFDSQTNQELEEMHHQALVSQRLGYTGGGMGLVLGLLATVFGYLKVDTATRGYYTRRLQAVAGVVILAEAALVALLVRGNLGL